MDKKHRPILFISGGLILLGVFFWQKNRIILHAKRFLGILEIGDNMGWNDPDFENKLRAVGWKPGSQWCVYFVKAMFADVYPRLKKLTYDNKYIIDYISGNSQTTYANFTMLSKNTNMFDVSGIPRVGDIVVWQNYSSGTATQQGHVGIVTKVNGDKFSTIEGNTSELGKTEETISRKEHSLGEYSKTSGLKLKGFIHYKN